MNRRARNQLRSATSSSCPALEPRVLLRSVSVDVDPTKLQHQFLGIGASASLYTNHWLEQDNKGNKLTRTLNLLKGLDLEVMKTYVGEKEPSEDGVLNDFIQIVKDLRSEGEHSPEIMLVLQRAPDELTQGNDNRDLKERGRFWTALAQHWYDILKYMSDQGVPVSYIEPLNESTNNELKDDIERFTEVLPRLRQIIADNGNLVSMPQIVGPSAFSVGANTQQIKTLKNNNVFGEVSIVGAHAYSPIGTGYPSQSNYQALKEAAGGKPIWITEATGKDQAGDPVTDSGAGNLPHAGNLSSAVRMIDAINGGASRYLIFNLTNPSGNNASILKLGFSKHARPEGSEIYAAVRQITAEQPDDLQVVDLGLSYNKTSDRVLAFYDPAMQDLWIHIVNLDNEQDTYKLNLPKGMTAEYKRGYQTDATAELARLDSSISTTTADGIELEVPGFSVQTHRISLSQSPAA